MNNLTRRLALVAAVLLSGVVHNSALAGAYFDRDVYISNDGLKAYGTLSAARWRSGSQSIGCTISRIPNTAVRCEARNRAGERILCTVLPAHPAFESALRLVTSISDSSYVYFTKRPTGGPCETIQVSNNSQHIR